MSDEVELPPANLILQALHGIRADLHDVHADLRELHAEQAKTNERLDQTNARLDQTNARLESLERRTTQGFLETNTKLAHLTGRVDVLAERVGGVETGLDRLGDRIDHLLTGQFGQDVRDLKARMSSVEEKLHGLGASEGSVPYGPKK